MPPLKAGLRVKARFELGIAGMLRLWLCLSLQVVVSDLRVSGRDTGAFQNQTFHSFRIEMDEH